MKILIIYSTKGGVSKECADILYSKLCGSFEVSVYDINDTPPSPDGFDVAVIGGSVRFGKLNKKLKSYLRTHSQKLSNINTALFICCGFTDSFEDYASMQFPKQIIPSLGIHFFGGELKPQKLKGIDKWIVKTLRADMLNDDFEAPDPDKSPLPEIIPENIHRLADRIRELL